MFSFSPAPALGSGSDLASDVGAWAGSAPLRELVAAFGGDNSVFDGDMQTVLARLDAFSDRWDTRRGTERHLAVARAMTQDQAGLVYAVADALGMRSPTLPKRTAYDHVFALGGLVQACIMRPAYAAALLRSGSITTLDFTALGGHRPFIGDEFAFAARAGLSGIVDEYEALDAGTRLAFQLNAPVESVGERSSSIGGPWTIRTYNHSAGYRVRVAAAPSTEPDIRRANTPDSYEWFSRVLAQLQPGQRMLAITTAIYVPAQHAAALRMLALPFGVEIETVGIAPHADLPLSPIPFDRTFSPSNYLQEIRATVQSYRALLEATLRNR